MKKTSKNLSLKTHTVRNLQDDALALIGGGSLSVSVSVQSSGTSVINPSGGITSLFGTSANPSGGRH